MPDDTQKVYVVVQDRKTLSPVPGANGTATVHLTTGQALVYPITTDDNGIGLAVPSILFSGQLPGSPVTVERRHGKQPKVRRIL